MDVTLSLTHDCNLACSYCYAGNKHRTSMSWETAKKALEFAFSFDSPSLQLGFFGGEPLLQWELLKRCSNEADKLAQQADVSLVKTVTTNATLVTDEKAKWLIENHFVPALSIDGNEQMHDITRPLKGGKSSFIQCMSGLDALLPHYPETEVIVVPSPENVAHLFAGVRFLYLKKGVRRVSINPNFYAEWPEKALKTWRGESDKLGDLFIELYRQGRPVALNFIDGKIITHLKCGFDCGDKCNFGEKEIAIAPSGRIYPCERLVANDDNDEMCIGHIESGFDEDKRQAILRRRGCVNAECLSCAIRSRCMNWCCCINYTITGAIDVTDGIVCFHEQMAVEVADRVGTTLFEERNPAFLARYYGEDFSPLEK